MTSCAHNADLGFDYPCIRCDTTPDDERLRSIGMQFTYGRTTFHGPTIGEQTDEMFRNARKDGIEPQYEGRAVLR
jgi:hypothetical protein